MTSLTPLAESCMLATLSAPLCSPIWQAYTPLPGTSITCFDTQIASLNEPLRLSTTLAFPKQRYPDLGVNLTDDELAFQHPNSRVLSILLKPKNPFSSEGTQVIKNYCTY